MRDDWHAYVDANTLHKSEARWYWRPTIRNNPCSMHLGIHTASHARTKSCWLDLHNMATSVVESLVVQTFWAAAKLYDKNMRTVNESFRELSVACLYLTVVTVLPYLIYQACGNFKQV